MRMGRDEELNSIYRSPNILAVREVKSKGIKVGRPLARMEECTSTLKILTGKPKEKRPVGRPRRS